jgi:hypothetical protein
VKSGPRQKSTSQTKQKLADHKFEEKEGSAHIVRKRCAGCYEKIRHNQRRRERGGDGGIPSSAF